MVKCCFLGANSYHGFYSLYESYLTSQPPQRLYVLKGGAGCGKSGFMRRIDRRMQEYGLVTRQILCSGDPDSLDGLEIPALKTVFFDGTAPHILEPRLVGQNGFYIDLSRFCLREAEGLQSYDASYREHYRKAYIYLNAAGKLESLSALEPAEQFKIRNRADALLRKEAKRIRREPGFDTPCFTEALTWKGLLSLQEADQGSALRRIALSGTPQETGLFLSHFRTRALELGYHTISCQNPLEPERLNHLLLPELELTITTGSGDRTIHLERLTRSGQKQSERVSQKETERLQAPLLRHAIEELTFAHRDHDLLEEQINPLIDFESVYQLAEQYARKLTDYAAASNIRSMEMP